MDIGCNEDSILPGVHPIRTLQGHRGAVHCIAWSLDGRCLLSASSDHTIKMWDIDTGFELRTFQGHEKPVLGVAMLPDGGRLVSASADQTIRVWDVNSGEEKQKITILPPPLLINTLAITPDGRHLVFAAGGSSPRVCA